MRNWCELYCPFEVGMWKRGRSKSDDGFGKAIQLELKFSSETQFWVWRRYTFCWEWVIGAMPERKLLQLPTYLKFWFNCLIKNRCFYVGHGKTNAFEN